MQGVRSHGGSATSLGRNWNEWLLDTFSASHKGFRGGGRSLLLCGGLYVITTAAAGPERSRVHILLVRIIEVGRVGGQRLNGGVGVEMVGDVRIVEFATLDLFVDEAFEVVGSLDFS